MVSGVEVKKHASRRDATTVGDLHAHPLLGDVFELLHRMAICNEDTPATRYAGEALRKLRQYEQQIINQKAAGSQ